MGFVPDELVEGAEVMVMAQNPGEYEERGERVTGMAWSGRRRAWMSEPNPRGPAPLIGPTGWEMEREFLPLAQRERGAIALANVLKCRQVVNGRRVNDLPTGKRLAQAVAQCMGAHLQIPESVQVIVAMGALAVEAMGCPGKVSAWRGFTWKR